MATYSIDQLIVNSPWAEPSSYWAYHRQTRFFTKEQGRRPAGYVTATPGAKSFDDPGVFRELPLVNQIRPRVKAWREANYPGVTGITRRLLEHWQDPEDKAKRGFLDEWCKAVNSQGGFGAWAWDVAFAPSDVHDILARHVPSAAGM